VAARATTFVPALAAQLAAGEGGVKKENSRPGRGGEAMEEAGSPLRQPEQLRAQSSASSLHQLGRRARRSEKLCCLQAAGLTQIEGGRGRDSNTGEIMLWRGKGGHICNEML
jgi:hypothetical protein